MEVGGDAQLGGDVDDVTLVAARAAALAAHAGEGVGEEGLAEALAPVVVGGLAARGRASRGGDADAGVSGAHQDWKRME